MRPLPRKAHHVPCRPFFYFFAFSILVITTPVIAQTVIKAEVGEGKTTHRFINFQNVCLEPHRYRVKSNVKYISFEKTANEFSIAGSSSHELKVLFDATKLKSGQYSGQATIRCLDCKKERKCSQVETEVRFELTVVGSLLNVAGLASKYKAILNKKLRELNAVVDAEAQKELDKIIKRGAKVFLDAGDDKRLQESYDNMEKLAKALVMFGVKIEKQPKRNSFAAHSRQTAEVMVVKRSVEKALVHVCPLFPFC